MIPWEIIGLLYIAGRLRVYRRTGLKGELVSALGVAVVLGTPLIFALWRPDSGQTLSLVVMVAGLVILNVGLLISSTLELDRRRQLFEGVSFFDKLVGNVPRGWGSEQNKTATSESKKRNESSLLIAAWIALLLAYRSWSHAQNGLLDDVSTIIFGLIGVWSLTYWFWIRRKRK